MHTVQDSSLQKHILFEYTSFDKVVFRGHIQRLFFEGSVISLLRNLGINNHSNGVMRILTDKFNSHNKKNCFKIWRCNSLVGRARKENISFKN